jgi:hypothetical protein
MNCGIAAIDRLMTDVTAPSVDPTDRQAVAAVQALLAGHGFRGLPSLLDGSCGTLGPATRASITAFRTAQRMVASDEVDSPTLRALVALPATTPVISLAYLALVLDVTCSALLPIAAVTMQLEGGGRFTAANWNTDRCGLSFGLIQWAQKPGRLHELLLAMDTAQPDLFTQILGAGDPDLARGLLLHTAKVSGGIDPTTGATTDPRFDLTAEPWRTRFIAIGRQPAFQKQQVTSAIAAFEASLHRIQQTLPVVTSQRGIAAMLDIANQFGDAGAASVASAAMVPGMSETEFLDAAGSETVARISRQYGSASAEALSTANRRQLVRTTPWLSDQPL